MLANAAHIKNVPGRKTDVKDATWIADLLAHGLIRGSFVPPTPIQDLRALMRTRKQLVREAARNTQRIQKALEDASIKLTGVVSDILGKSGRAILDALVTGETDPEKLVELTQGRLKASRQTLVEALRGHVRDHHRFVIKLHLDQIDALHKAVRDLEARVEEHLDPFRKNVEILTTIPGIVTPRRASSSRRSAATWPDSQPRRISCPGQGCALAPTRALANDARRASATPRPG